MTRCRHCRSEIVPCGQYGWRCWAKGWLHARLEVSMPVGAHFCGGDADGPLAEP